MPRYHRLAHQLEIPPVKVGQWINYGDLIGKCGSTGNSSGPHCHYDIPLVNLGYTKWRGYVRGLSKGQVRSQYADPKPFIKNNYPIKAELPLIGYKFLQPVYEKGSVYFHPGQDLNGINDLGKPIYSPVEGRVVHVGVDDVGASKAKSPAIKKYLERQLNGGWGYFVVIEEKPGFKIPA